MIKFDLTNVDNSDIKYKISKFPDGQQTIDLEGWCQLLTSDDNVKISSRLNSFKDLELIICAVHSIRNIEPSREILLYVPYFIGARSDRKFKQGGINYLKQVICPIINSLNLNRVEVLDPHSDVLEACLNNYKKKNNHSLVKFALEQIDNKDGAQDRICLVSPDAGSYKKIFDVAKEFNIENIIAANKVRDVRTGNIVKTEIPDLRHFGPPPGYHEGLKYVIIDDICDGGRTFIELAKVIKERTPNAEIYLVVTHGIFSAGLKPLAEWFKCIYTTNSVVDKEEPNFFNNNESYLHKLSQFKVI
jgi:ribose-phosphate pyrophosphokinase